MKKLEITKGIYRFYDKNKDVELSKGKEDSPGYHVVCEEEDKEFSTWPWECATFYNMDNDLTGENAAKIAINSLNTYQECELLPSELLKQNKELREALQKLVYLHGCEQEGMSSGQPTPSEWFDAVNEAAETLNQ